MALEEIIAKLTRTGAFIHSDGEISNNFVEVAAITTEPEWVRITTEAIVPVFRKMSAKRIAVRENMDVALATHVSKELNTPLLLVPRVEQFHTQPIRGQFRKNDSVVVFATCVKHPVSLTYTCEVLKKNGLNVKGMVILINRGKGIEEFFSDLGIEVVSILNYPTDDDAHLEKSREYIKIISDRHA